MAFADTKCQLRVLGVLFSVIGFSSLCSDAQADAVKLTGPQITQTLQGKEIFGIGSSKTSRQVFKTDGSTVYWVGENQQAGNWKVVDDQYCSVWPPSENWVCYDVLGDNRLILFKAPDGSSSAYSPTH